MSEKKSDSERKFWNGDLERRVEAGEVDFFQELSAATSGLGVTSGLQLKLKVRAKVLERNIRAGGKVLYAEGDSWFDFPWWLVFSPASDVLDALALKHKYVIPDRAAKAGDTIANMARPENLAFLTQQLKSHRPFAFLLSAGGNDLFGIDGKTKVSRFHDFLNPAGSANRINTAQVKAFLKIVRQDYGRLIAVAEKNHVPTLVHGYADAYASGKKAGWIVGGPWIKPMVRKRGYNPKTDGHGLVSDVGNYFNDMLRSLASQRRGSVHYVDARPGIVQGNWHDELHLWPGGWRRVADSFHAVLSAI